MTIGFAPPTPLYEYIRKVETLIGGTLTAEEREWAAISNLGDIKASRFAGWLALSASPPLLPQAPPVAERSPLPATEVREGDGIVKEISK
jgi:hypothetical protein